MGDLTKNFSTSEFVCRCDDECQSLVNVRIATLLQQVRDAVNGDQDYRLLRLGEFKIVITSGARCPEHNLAVGGAATSSHLSGCAADVVVDSTTYRYFFLKHAMKYFTRVFIYPGHIHVDCDEEKHQFVCGIVGG